MTAPTWVPGVPIYDPDGADNLAEPLYDIKGVPCVCLRGRRSPSWCVDRSPDAASWPTPANVVDDLSEVAS